jgi:hypothetical protein
MAFWLNAAGYSIKIFSSQTRKGIRQKAAPNFLNLAVGRGTGGRNLSC